MKVGDLVCAVWDSSRKGMLVERVFDRSYMTQKVFTVLWNDGTTGNYVWHGDLERLQ